MPTIEIILKIEAPIERVFDLSRDIDLHIRSTEGTSEKAIAGVTTGLIGLGEEVTWEATHLGIRQRLTTRITAFSRPHHFRDSQISGAFARFDHDHFFNAEGTTTIMREVFDYQSPLGPLGRLADFLFLRAYMRRFLTRRALTIRREATSYSPTSPKPANRSI